MLLFAKTLHRVVRCYDVQKFTADTILFREIQCKEMDIFSSPEPKAQDELIGWDSSWRPSVRAFTLSNINISETSWPILIKLHLDHHWGGGLAALGFGPDRIRTLVSMATDSSYRVMIKKLMSLLPLSVLKNPHRLIMGEIL